MNSFLTQRQTQAKPCVFTAHFANANIVFSKRLTFCFKMYVIKIQMDSNLPNYKHPIEIHLKS